METKYTEGEWKIDDTYTKDMEKCYWYNITDSKKRVLAEVKGIHYDINNKECDANAKLIAAVLDDNIAIKKPVQQLVDEAHTRIDLKKLIYDIDIVIQKEKQKQDA